jgi:hypothetical protein
MNIGGVSADASSSTVADAVSTLIPVGSVTCAVPVDSSNVPANALLCTDVLNPASGMTVTCTSVPVGTLTPSNSIVTGLLCDDGTVTSGDDWNEPFGLAGEFIPATVFIFSCGGFVRVRGLGSPLETDVNGDNCPVRPVKSYASNLM